jgi:hypothetical protein
MAIGIFIHSKADQDFFVVDNYGAFLCLPIWNQAFFQAKKREKIFIPDYLNFT